MSEGSNEPKRNEFERNFIIEYFKEMRTEINHRVTTHSNFVIFKIASSGAILSFLLTTESKGKLIAYGVLIVPLIAMLYDIMIAKNVRNIHLIAVFIRESLEEEVSKDLKLWEEHTGQRDGGSRCYGAGDVLYLSMFTLFTVLCTGLLLPRSNAILALVSVLIVILLFVIFVFTCLFMLECFSNSRILPELRRTIHKRVMNEKTENAMEFVFGPRKESDST